MGSENAVFEQGCVNFSIIKTKHLGFRIFLSCTFSLMKKYQKIKADENSPEIISLCRKITRPQKAADSNRFSRVFLLDNFNNQFS